MQAATAAPTSARVRRDGDETMSRVTEHSMDAAIGFGQRIGWLDAGVGWQTPVLPWRACERA